TMLALAACSSAPSTPETNGAGQPPADHNPGAQAEPGNPAPNPAPNPTANAKPAGQEPQGRPNYQALVDESLKTARESMGLRLFADARNEAAFVLEIDNQNAEARDILRRCNEVLGDRPDTVGIKFSDNILQVRIALERERLLVQQELDQGAALQQRE